MRPVLLAREPLVHFVMVGALLFGVDRARHPRSSAIAPVSADEAIRQGLREEFARRNGRAPSATELRGMVDGYLDDELLYREALALGLDRGDPIVRRRLVQKMELTLQDLGASREPTDAELQRLLTEEPTRWASLPSTSLMQVYFNTERRGATAETDAREALRRLTDGADFATQGDPFITGNALHGQSDEALDTAFGAGISTSLRDITVGRWVGPLRSRYGLHLVRVEARHMGALPPLASVRGSVRARWIERAQEEARRQALQALRARYRVAAGATP